MKYNREMIEDKYKKEEKLKYIFFWGHTQKDNKITKSCFSQWYPCTFVFQQIKFAVFCSKKDTTNYDVFQRMFR